MKDKSFPIWKLWYIRYDVETWGGSRFFLRTPLFTFEIGLMASEWDSMDASDRIYFHWLPRGWRIPQGQKIYRYGFRWKLRRFYLDPSSLQFIRVNENGLVL
jgi:hypothetical protein